MKVLTTDRDRVADFVCQRAGMSRDREPGFKAIGLLDGDEVVAGVLYEDYTGSCIEVHVAGDGKNWLNKALLHAMFAYPFKQLGCKIIRGRVSSSNIAAIRFDMRLGFKLEHLLKDATPEGDVWIVSMRREECRFLEM